jgi:pseudouridine-5'-phosphate glycosidase
MLSINEEVTGVLAQDGPVVALESTLVAQGLPWPANLETARTAEAAVRSAGALAATIAVVDGQIRVGMSAALIERLAEPGQFPKAGRRDLAAVLARGGCAATTVSATLWIARKAGIGVLATGGLGGVHRRASESFDISSDLDELARADGMLVVCSGVKSILDVPATLEVLETRGVAVAGYGTDEFPAFTTVSSGVALDARVNSPAEAAAVVHAHRKLGLPGALVLAQRIAADLGIDRGELEAALAVALEAADASGVTGKALTPFLLEAVRTATGGRSLHANRALIVANAGLAGSVAVALGARH